MGTARSEEKAKPVLDELGEGSDYLHLDLGDLDSARQCAKDFLTRDEALHGLINNAGVAGQRGITKSGFELAFGTNHVGHFLLTNLLLDTLKASAPARVIVVASGAHKDVQAFNFDDPEAKSDSYTASRGTSLLYTLAMPPVPSLRTTR